MFRWWSGFFQSDKLYIHFNGGDTFQKIIFDLINSIFKCWFRFKFVCFNFTVQTKLIKIIVKRCRNFMNMLLLYNELLWKLDSYFIENFSSFWEAQCLWDERNQLFSICFDYWCYFFMESINSSSGCLNILSDLSILAWSFVSKQSSKDGVSEVMVSTSWHL